MEETVKEVSMPRIGDKAPEFKAKTTQGVIHYPADYLSPKANSLI